MIGNSNPFPTQIGGGPTRVEQTYQTLKKMVGVNGSSRSEDSIESDWRWAKSFGLTAIGATDERAALQAFPQVATDLLSAYEEVLGIPTDTTRSFEQRRDVVVPDYTGTPEAWWSSLDEQIKQIDSRATVVLENWENASTTMMGRAFEPYVPDSGYEYDPGGSRKATSYPAANTSGRIRVLYDIGTGLPDREQLRKIVSMQELLNEVLPVDRSFFVVTSTDFILDQSRLDITGFGT